MLEINPRPHPKFRPLYEIKNGLVICIGGRGGMKSYETSKWAATRLVSNFETRGVLLRDQAVSIENSILNEVKQRLDMINIKSGGYYNSVYDVQNKSIKNNLKKRDAIFTLGLQDSANYKQARLKSLSDLDFSILEEAEDVREEEKYFKLIDSIRHSEAINIINLNVPDKGHWIVKRFFNTVPSEFDGWYKLEPKKMEGVYIIQSNYKDNEHLPKNIVKRYEEYGDPNSPFYNPDYYYNQILGLCSEGLFGRIFTHIKAVSLSDYNNFDFPPIYGLDFGFTNDPTALIEIKIHNQNLYERELIYELNMTNEDISRRLTELDIPKNAVIYADSAEPKSIEELSRLGWNIWPALKGADSVNSGIQLCKQYNIFSLENSKNLWIENQNYKWKLDRNKEPLNVPHDSWNHLMDARRYALNTHINSLTQPTFYAL